MEFNSHILSPEQSQFDDGWCKDDIFFHCCWSILLFFFSLLSLPERHRFVNDASFRSSVFKNILFSTLCPYIRSFVRLCHIFHSSSSLFYSRPNNIVYSIEDVGIKYIPLHTLALFSILSLLELESHTIPVAAAIVLMFPLIVHLSLSVSLIHTFIRASVQIQKKNLHMHTCIICVYVCCSLQFAAFLSPAYTWWTWKNCVFHVTTSIRFKNIHI